MLFRTFANAHNGYGAFEDLRAATVDDCADFFDRYYTPANAVLTVCGGFDVADATALVERHFGDVPFRPRPERPSFAEPAPTEQRRGEKVDALAPLPALAAGWRLPDPVADLPGYLAYILLGQVLSDGESSRLHRALVAERQLVNEIWAVPGLLGGPLDARDPDVFVLGTLYAPDVTADTVLDAAVQEIRRLADDGPTGDELRMSQARFCAALYRENDGIAARTRSLGTMELLHGRAELLSELPELIAGVSGADVAAAAAALDPATCGLLIVAPGTEN